jgi:hypothetical protein
MPLLKPITPLAVSLRNTLGLLGVDMFRYRVALDLNAVRLCGRSASVYCLALCVGRQLAIGACVRHLRALARR